MSDEWEPHSQRLRSWILSPKSPPETLRRGDESGSLPASGTKAQEGIALLATGSTPAWGQIAGCPT